MKKPKLRVQRYVDKCRKGFYVEAGAFNGISDSQTLWLYECGWRGICVEPCTMFQYLKENRPKDKLDNRVLWNEDGNDVDFLEVCGTELSGLPQCFGDHWNREKMQTLILERKTVKLTTLLDEHGAPPIIDLLVLDTEGSEFEIMQAHDFDKYKFRWALIEHNFVKERQTRMKELMSSHGYYWKPEDGGLDDLFYLKGELE